MAKFCSNCGKLIKEDQDVCLNCGKVINDKATQKDPNSKSKIVAGLLGTFFGALGVHNFYLGYNNKALTQLLLSILSCGVLSFISAIWGLIEGIQILTGTISVDAQGKPIVD